MRKIAFDENIAMDMLIDHTDNGMSFSKLAKKIWYVYVYSVQTC